MIASPTIGETYRAGDLPPLSIVRSFGDSEYVRCERIDSLMRWEQPIPGSEGWQVVYVGHLASGRMTDREKREVRAARMTATVSELRAWLDRQPDDAMIGRAGSTDELVGWTCGERDGQPVVLLAFAPTM